MWYSINMIQINKARGWSFSVQTAAKGVALHEYVGSEDEEKTGREHRLVV